MVRALLRLRKMILSGKGKTVQVPLLLLSSKPTFLFLYLVSQLEPINRFPLPDGVMLDAVHRGCWWDTGRLSREGFFFLAPVYFYSCGCQSWAGYPVAFTVQQVSWVPQVNSLLWTNSSPLRPHWQTSCG